MYLSFFKSRPAINIMLAVALATSRLHAAPYGPDGMETEWTQPDGSKIQLRVFGDEFHGRTETLDGYTVVFDPATKSYYYADTSEDGRELVSKGMAPGKGNPRAMGLAKRLDISPEARKAKAKARFEEWDNVTGNSIRWAGIKAERAAYEEAVSDAKEEGGPMPAPPSFTTIGDKVGLTLLIDFSDDPATIPQASVIDYCNGDNYTGYGNNGSVKKYYQDNSNNLLNYTNTVTAYIRMAQPKSYYNVTTLDSGARGRLLISDAIDIMKALPNYNSEILPTFDTLTVDGSNRAVACNVFFAGGNSGVWSKGLWPHSWSLSAAKELSAGGKKVYKYQITNLGTSLTLGTFCHENGHMLCGYPDIYDYDYDSAGGAGGFCLMNSGGHGTNPVLINAYLKRASGWTTTTELTSASNLTGTLVSTVGHADYNKIYRYANPAAPTTEYFLFENRRKTGRDANIAASGIAIWHVDQLGNHNNQSLANNTSHANYEVSLIQADNLWQFQSNTNSGDSKDLYYLGNTAAAYTNTFNDASSPDAKWWSGASSGLNVYNISSAGATMTLQFGLPANTISVTAPNGGEQVYFDSTQNISWLSNTPGNVKIDLYKGGVLHAVLSASETNDGSYSWVVSSGLPAGNDYTIRISSVATPAYTDSSNAAFSILLQPTLADALDTTGLTWTNSGNASWFAQSATTKDGIDAAQSGVIDHSQNSFMETTVTGPGTLTFWWKISSESNYDFLRFYLDGAEQTGSLARISGTVDWVQKTVAIPSGSHTVKWGYTKDGSVVAGSDAAWVDQFVYTPSTAPEIAVEQPVGTDLADGSASVDCGVFNLSSSSPPITFTVKNLGDGNLTGLVLSKDGAHSADFVLGSLGATTLAPGASTTFDVTFSPGDGGARNAAIHLASNDANENPFDITLTGTGVTVGTLAVTPAGSLTASGSLGGPFSPISLQYTLGNPGSTTIDWTAAKTAAWVDLDFTSGTLAPGANTTVTVSINSTADSLPINNHSDTVTFTNTTNGNGDSTRGVTLAVNPIPAIVTIGDLSQTYSPSTPRSVSVTTDPPGLAHTVTYNGSPTVPTDAGTYAVVATITDPSYAGSDSEDLVIAKAAQSINFAALPDVTDIDAPFALGATATSGLAVSYTSSSTAIATVDGNTVTIVGLGTTTITAIQAGDANYAAATPVPQTLTVVRANPLAIITGAPYKVLIGQTLSLIGSASQPSHGNTITSYGWDLNGDDNYSDASGATPPAISVTELISTWGMTQGLNTIQLKVTDSAEKIAIVTTTVEVILSLTWDANGTGANQTDGVGAWLGANQWWDGSANVTWASGSSVTFGNTGAGGAVTLASPTTVNTLTFNVFSGTYTLGTATQAITLNGGITKNSGSAAATLISPITLGGSQTWTNNSGGTLTSSGVLNNGGFLLTIGGSGTTSFIATASVITGSGGLTKNGSGTLLLGQGGTPPAHNYTGPTTINGGVVMVFGNKTAGNITLNGGMLTDYFQQTTVFTSGLGTGANQIQIHGNSGFGGGNGTSNWRIGTAGSVLAWGSTHFDMTTLKFMTAADNLGPTIFGTANLDNGLDLGAAARTIDVLNASTPPPATSGGRIAGVISNGSLIKTGGGNLILANAANTYAGTTTISAGFLSVATLANGGSNSGIGSSSAAASNLLIGNGATFRYTGGAISTNRSFTINGTAAGHGAALDASGSGAVNYTATATPAYGTVDQTRTLTLTGTNTGSNTLAALLTDNGSGAVSLTKTGTGTWILSNAGNTYTGATIIGGGSLQLINAAALPGGTADTGGTSALIFNGGVLGLAAGDFTRSLGSDTTVTAANFTGAGGWAAYGADRNVNLGGALAQIVWATPDTGFNAKTLILGAATATHKVTLQNDLDLGTAVRTVQTDDGTGAVDGELSGIITGGAGGGLTKTGAGVLSLSNANTYTGVTTVNAGVLRLDHATALSGGIGSSGGSSALVFTGGVLGLGNGNFERPLGTNTTATAVNFTNAGGWAAYGADRTVNLGGASGTITWATANTGFNNQTLILSAASATHTVDLQNPLVITTTRTVQVDNGAAGIDAKLSGNISGTGGGISKTGAGTLIISGNMSQTGGLTVSTASGSTLILSGTNTYSGTTINAFSNPTSGSLIFQGMQAVSNSTTLQQTHGGGVGGFGPVKFLDDSATPAGKAGFGLSMIATNTSHGMNLFVGNNNTANGGNSSGTTTGSTIALGSLSMGQGTNAGNTSSTFTVTGANGYRLQINNLTLATRTDLTAWTGIVNPTSAPLTIAGNVTQTNPSATVSTLFQLDGTAAGNQINGNILQPSGAALRVTKSNTGTWSLAGNNSYTGVTTISGGVLRITHASALGSTTAGTTQSGTSALEIDGTGGAVLVGAETLGINGGGISNGGALRNIAGDNTYGGIVTLAAQSRINSDSGTLLLNNATAVSGAAQNLLVGGAGNIAISGAITTTTGALTKDGAGTLMLYGTNTYTGLTTVSTGKLFVNGDQTSATGAVSVAANATLGGTGIIGGSTTIAANGKLEFDLSTAPGSHDKLELAAGKTLTFGTSCTLTITSSGGASNGDYTLVTAPGGIGTLPTFTFNHPLGWAATISKVGNDLVLNVTVPDTTPPTLVSMTDDKSGGPVVVNTLVTYTVTFNEDMDAATVTAADFGNAGTSAVTIGAVSETSPGVFTVDATPTTAGTLQLQVSAAAGLKDLAGNDLNTTSAILDDTTFTIENTTPTLTGITDDQSGGPASINTLVTYTVTFSEDMDAATVTAADFGNAGTSAGTIGAVAEISPGVFTVEATPTTAGTLQLRINQSAVLENVVGNDLNTSSDILDDTILTVLGTPPTLTGITDDKSGGPVSLNTLVTYTVNFSEDMDAATVTAADFGNAGSSSVTIGSVGETLPGVFTVQATPTSAGTLRLQINATAELKNSTGIALDTTAAILDDTTLTVDGIVPTLATITDDKSGGSVTVNTLVTYTVTFSEDMDAATFTAADFGNAGSSSVTIGSVGETLPGVFTVEATPTSAGTLQLAINAAAELKDVAGNNLNTTSALPDDTTLNVDGTVPTLVSIADDKSGGSVTVNTLVTYTVTFSEDMDAATVTAADFGNAGSSSVTISTVSEISPGIFTVEATPTSAGTLQLQINAAAELKDPAGNALDTAAAILDNTTLTVSVADPYAVWSGGAAFDDDANGDGVDNGLAWLLGATDKDQNALGRLPVVTQNSGNLTLTFRCLKAANRDAATLNVQYSRDLGITDPWHDAAVPDEDVTVNNVVFDTTGDGDFINVQATIPAGAASPGSLLFGRLIATNAP